MSNLSSTGLASRTIGFVNKTYQKLRHEAAYRRIAAEYARQGQGGTID
ncbi:hypothetical protein [Ancylobacter sp. IITR112]